MELKMAERVLDVLVEKGLERIFIITPSAIIIIKGFWNKDDKKIAKEIKKIKKDVL
jgi:hypothetical protein